MLCKGEGFREEVRMNGTSLPGSCELGLLRPLTVLPPPPKRSVADHREKQLL